MWKWLVTGWLIAPIWQILRSRLEVVCVTFLSSYWWPCTFRLLDQNSEGLERARASLYFSFIVWLCSHHIISVASFYSHIHNLEIIPSSLEKVMATYSIILTWRIPWTEEPGRLQSMGSWRVRHDWATDRQTDGHMCTHTHLLHGIMKTYWKHGWKLQTPWVNI